MARILQPKCSFLHSYFRCHLPIEAVDIEVKITSMQGTHVFRRDRTTQLIKCIPWSSRLCPHPTIIKKMRTFLELEGKLGPIPQSTSNQFRPPQPDTNPNISKITEKRKRIAPTKRFKAKIPAKPNSNKATAQLPNTKALINTESQKSLNQVPESRPPLLEDAPICADTPWPEAGKMLGNLIKTRKDWLIPPNNNANDKNSDTAAATNPKPPLKLEPQNQETPKVEKCGWGQNCPICKMEEEDWNSDHQRQLQQQPQVQMTQMQHPQALNYQNLQSFQRSNSKTFGVSDQYPSQSKLLKQWEEEMERLNRNYNLDCFFFFFWTLNLIQNWMKGKNTNMNMVMRHSFNEKNYAIPYKFKMYLFNIILKSMSV